MAGWLQGLKPTISRFIPGAGPGTGWQTPETLEATGNGPYYAFTPNVAINAAGNIAVVWDSLKTCAPNPATGAVKGRRRMGGVWDPPLASPPSQFDTAPCDKGAGEPDVGIDGQGRIHVVWVEQDSTGYRFIHTRDVDPLEDFR